MKAKLTWLSTSILTTVACEGRGGVVDGVSGEMSPAGVLASGVRGDMWPSSPGSELIDSVDLNIIFLLFYMFLASWPPFKIRFHYHINIEM